MNVCVCVLICTVFFQLAGPMSAKLKRDAVAKQIFEKWKNKEFIGHVKATTKTTITISDLNKPTLLITLPLYGELAGGSFDDATWDSNAYRIQDLKPGDAVSLYTLVENKVTFCASITIWERPGGLIPPSQKPDKTRPWHEMRNASNAKRDEGKPVPEPDPQKPKAKE